MKKKLILIFVAMLSMIFALVFVSCNKDATPPVESNVSREICAFYVGETENFAVSIEVGKREKNFVADGVSREVVDMVELVIIPLKVHDYEEYAYTLKKDDCTLSGRVKGNEFGEYATIINLDFAPATITIGEGEGAECIDLVNVLEGKLTTSDAINVAEKEFAERIEGAKNDGTYNREIYVKLITGDRQNYYYYVSYVGEGVDYWALLINPTTGEVVSKR